GTPEGRDRRARRGAGRPGPRRQRRPDARADRMIVDGLVYLGASHVGDAQAAAAALAGMADVGTSVALAVPAHPTGADFGPVNAAVAEGRGAVGAAAGRAARR